MLEGGMPGRSVSGAVLVVVASLMVTEAAMADPPPAPVNESPPVASPDPAAVGATATVTPGTWSGEDPTSTVSYQWYRYYGAQTTTPISGATGTSYTVTTGDYGGLTVLVTVTAGSGAVSSSKFSNAIRVLGESPPINTAKPVLSGKGVRGATLHVTTGAWTQYPSPIAGPISYSYQWIRCAPGCDFPIAGATKPSYTVQPADWGRGLAVKVTATDNLGSSYAYSNGIGVQPPTVTEVDRPFPWIDGDPLLISQPAHGECFGDACDQGTVTALLHNGGYRSVLTAHQRGKLAVAWIVVRGVKPVTLGTERFSFRRPGKYQRRFVLTNTGRSMLRAGHRFQFFAVAWFADLRGNSSGCAYTGTVTAAGEILIVPNSVIPPDGTDPFTRS
jgi:hypothetical protein